MTTTIPTFTWGTRKERAALAGKTAHRSRLKANFGLARPSTSEAGRGGGRRRSANGKQRPWYDRDRMPGEVLGTLKPFDGAFTAHELQRWGATHSLEKRRPARGSDSKPRYLLNKCAPGLSAPRPSRQPQALSPHRAPRASDDNRAPSPPPLPQPRHLAG